MTATRQSIVKSAATGLLVALAAFGLWQAVNAPNAPQPTTSYASAAARASASVVQIESKRREINRPSSNDPIVEELFGASGLPSTVNSQGSGIVVRADGHILTNYHVVRDAYAITVTLTSRAQLPAIVVGVDAETDIAVLRVETDIPLIPIAQGDDGRLAVGDIVLAIGNPYGLGQTVTQGIVSALRRQVGGFSVYDQFIQTDAAINPGSSGGALVNLAGELIGLNTSVFNGAADARGISFAIPARMLFSIVDQLIDSGSVRRGWLGVSGIDVSSSRLRDRAISGVLVTGVYADSPAAVAGLRPGDVIDGLDQLTTPNVRSLQYVSSHIAPGTIVKLYARRNGKSFDTALTMGERLRQ